MKRTDIKCVIRTFVAVIMVLIMCLCMFGCDKAETKEDATQSPTAVPTCAPIEKIDYSNLVTDAYSGTINDVSYAIPTINLDGADVERINNEIWDIYYTNYVEKMKEASQMLEYNNDVALSYDWYVNGDVLSLIVNQTARGIPFNDYSVYNVSISKSQQISSEEVVKASKISMDEYYLKAEQAMGSYVWKSVENSDMLEAEGNIISFNYALKNTIEKSNVEKSEPFINKNGELCIKAIIYCIAGPEYSRVLMNLEDFELVEDYDKEAAFEEKTTTPQNNTRKLHDNDSLTVKGILSTEYYELTSTNTGTVAIVTLNDPIEVYAYGTNYDGVLLKVDSVQVGLEKSEYEDYIGKEVSITGNVMFAHTGHHQRDIVLVDCSIN